MIFYARADYDMNAYDTGSQTLSHSLDGLL